MSIYQLNLPKAFPWVAKVRPSTARVVINELLSDSREDVPQGSSFALTVDNWDGTWNLWMSNVTYEFVREEHPGVLTSAHLTTDTRE